MNHVDTVRCSTPNHSSGAAETFSASLTLPHLLRLHDPCVGGREYAPLHAACTSVTHVDTVLNGGLVGIHALQADGLNLVHTPPSVSTLRGN
jgi:hypothetical protein